MNEDKERTAYPEGYEHVQERLAETTNRLNELDDRIANVPPDQGPTRQYKTPGFLSSRQFGSRDRTISALKDYQQQIKNETWEKTEKDTQEAESKTRRLIRDDVREELFPNGFRQMSAEERQKKQSENKDLETSQDFMDAKLVQHKVEQREMDTKPTTVGETASAQFSRSLRFTQMRETGRSITEPGKSRGRDLDRD